MFIVVIYKYSLPFDPHALTHITILSFLRLGSTEFRSFLPPPTLLITVLSKHIPTFVALQIAAQQTRDIDPMLGQCWASVVDAVPTLPQHWVNVLCLLAVLFFVPDCSAEGNSVRMEEGDSGNYEQEWDIEGNKIVSRSDPDKVLDIKKNNDENGAKLCMYEYKGGDNQHWTIEYVWWPASRLASEYCDSIEYALIFNYMM